MLHAGQRSHPFRKQASRACNLLNAGSAESSVPRARYLLALPLALSVLLVECAEESLDVPGAADGDPDGHALAPQRRHQSFPSGHRFHSRQPVECAAPYFSNAITSTRCRPVLAELCVCVTRRYRTGRGLKRQV